TYRVRCGHVCEGRSGASRAALGACDLDGEGPRSCRVFYRTGSAVRGKEGKMPRSVRQFRFAAALVGFAIPVVACNGSITNHSTDTGTAGTSGTATAPAVLGGKSPEEVLASCTAPSPRRSTLRRVRH